MVVYRLQNDLLVGERELRAACNDDPKATFKGVKPITDDFTDGRSTKYFVCMWNGKFFILFATSDAAVPQGNKVYRFKISTGAVIDTLHHGGWNYMMMQTCPEAVHATA